MLVIFCLGGREIFFRKKGADGLVIDVKTEENIITDVHLPTSLFNQVD